MNFFTGIIVGIVISTVGFSGLARWADQGVQVIKHQSQQLAR